MATNSMIPYSNPAGNNQTTPGAGATPTSNLALPGAPGVAGAVPVGSTAASSNPLVPAGSAALTGAVPTASTGTSPLSNTAGSGELAAIYGGVGTDIGGLIAGMSGTDSVILQDYVNSLQPQEAKAQAQTNAALGAGGVSANSSVAGLADANLQAQETAAIAGEKGQLTDQEMQLQAQMLTGMAPSAEQFTAEQAAMPYQMIGAAVGTMGKMFSA